MFWTFPVQYDDPTLDPQDREEYPVWSSGSPKQPSEYQMFYAGYNAPWWLEDYTDPEDTCPDAYECFGVFNAAQPWLEGVYTDTERWEYSNTPLSYLCGDSSFHTKLGSGYYYIGCDLQIDNPSYFYNAGIYGNLELYSVFRYIYGYKNVGG